MIPTVKFGLFLRSGHDTSCSKKLDKRKGGMEEEKTQPLLTTRHIVRELDEYNKSADTMLDSTQKQKKSPRDDSRKVALI